MFVPSASSSMSPGEVLPSEMELQRRTALIESKEGE